MGKRQGRRKKSREIQVAGAASFDDFYQDVWGSRWRALQDALLEPPGHAARINPWADFDLVTRLLGASPPLVGLDGCHEAIDLPSPHRDDTPLAPYYLMDAASIVAAHALEVQPGHKVLDMCSAPGGKGLILAQAIGQEGSLVVNEPSPTRRDRLQHVLRAYLPPQKLEQVRVTDREAQAWHHYEVDAYDRVLVDAPCSSERHVMRNEWEVARWNPSRPRRQAERQMAILRAALDVVRPGGRVVYSTCALLRQENDDVVSQVLGDTGGRVRVLEVAAIMGEPTRFGWQILPDVTGWGPIYFSVLERLR